MRPVTIIVLNYNGKAYLEDCLSSLARTDYPEYSVILVDDGIASGFTLRVAVEALKNKSANEIIIAVPTGHQESLKCLVDEVKAVYCANVRSGWSFAVADAYKRWSDVVQTEALEILKRFSSDNT